MKSKSMEKERKFDGIWDAKRVLADYLWYSDENGYIPYHEVSEDSPYGIRMKRFYAALRAYGKIEKEFLMDYDMGYRIGDIEYGLLSETRSQEKMEELRELLKHSLRYDFSKQYVYTPIFLKDKDEVCRFFKKLFEYRKELFVLDMKWGGVLECSRTMGIVIEATSFLYYKHIKPACEVIDRMLILLMGDDYDKSFTEKELFHYGYPNVTDEELYQMESEIEW